MAQIIGQGQVRNNLVNTRDKMHDPLAASRPERHLLGQSWVSAKTFSPAGYYK
jgi:hypothetical protein